jgi:hypothetical protein
MARKVSRGEEGGGFSTRIRGKTGRRRKGKKEKSKRESEEKGSRGEKCEKGRERNGNKKITILKRKGVNFFLLLFTRSSY